jgi:hypothetical protein
LKQEECIDRKIIRPAGAIALARRLTGLVVADPAGSTARSSQQCNDQEYGDSGLQSSKGKGQSLSYEFIRYFSGFKDTFINENVNLELCHAPYPIFM